MTTDSTSVPITIEDLQAYLIDLVVQERLLRWERADACRAMLEQAQEDFGMPKMVAAKTLGSAMGKSAHFILLEERMSVVFPAEYRYPDVDLMIFRLCLGTDDPIGTLEMAIEQDWSTKDLRAYLDSISGKPEKTRIVLRGEMDWPSHKGNITIRPEDITKMTLPDGLDAVKIKATISA